MRDGSARISKQQLPTTRHICVWNIGWVITLLILSLSTLYGLEKKRVELACLVWEYVGTNFPSSLSEDNITIVTSHLTSSASSPIKNYEKDIKLYANELNLSLYSGVACNSVMMPWIIKLRAITRPPQKTSTKPISYVFLFSSSSTHTMRV